MPKPAQRTPNSQVSRLSPDRNKPATASWLSLACGAALLLGTATVSQAQPTTVTITGSPLGVTLGCDGDWDPACIVAGVPTPSRNGLDRRGKDGYWVHTFNLSGGIGYQYKVIADAVLNLTNFNNPWRENYGFGGQQDGPNIPLNVPGSGNVPVTFYYNELTNLIVDSVNTPIVVLSQGSLQQAMGCPTGSADPDCYKTLMTDIAKTGSVTLKVPSTAAPAGTTISGIQMAVYNPGLGTYNLVTPTPSTLTMPNVQVAQISYNVSTHALSIAESILSDGPTEVSVIGDFQTNLGCATNFTSCATTDMAFAPYIAGGNSGVWRKALHIPAGTWRYLIEATEGGVNKYLGRETINFTAFDAGDPSFVPGVSLTLNITNPAGQDVIFVYDHKKVKVLDNVNSSIVYLKGNVQDQFGCGGTFDDNCMAMLMHDDNHDGIYTFDTQNIFPTQAQTDAFDFSHWVGLNLKTLTLDTSGAIVPADLTRPDGVNFWTNFNFGSCCQQIPSLQHPAESEARVQITYNPALINLDARELYDARCNGAAIKNKLNQAITNNPDIGKSLSLVATKKQYKKGFPEILTLLDKPVVVDVQATIDGGSPDFCKVSVTYDVENRPDHSVSSYISRVFLPLSGWNGKMIGFGGSGANSGLSGGANPDVASYAQFSHGTGVSSNQAIQTLMLNVIGTHISTVYAKTVLQDFYPQGLQYSMWSGCSRGGIQGVQIMESYPADYQGVIAGAALEGINRDQYDLQIANLRKKQISFNGNTSIETLDLAAEQKVDNYILDQCDANDGVVDRIISDPLSCKISLRKMQKALSLSDNQIDYIRALIRDYRIAGGKAEDFVTPGWFADFPFVDFNSRDIGGFFAGSANFAFNQNITDVFYLDMPAAIATYRQSLKSGRTLSNTKDLSQFKKAGGKAILWTGSRDNLVNPAAYLDYYLSARKTSGKSVQFYLAPGVNHCGIDRARDPIAGLVNVNLSPPARTDVLKQLEQWIETGKAPEQIPAISGDLVNQRPWCPYPLVARRINASLPDPNYANYKCVNPDRDEDDHESYPADDPED